MSRTYRTRDTEVYDDSSNSRISKARKAALHVAYKKLRHATKQVCTDFVLCTR